MLSDQRYLVLHESALQPLQLTSNLLHHKIFPGECDLWFFLNRLCSIPCCDQRTSVQSMLKHHTGLIVLNLGRYWGWGIEEYIQTKRMSGMTRFCQASDGPL